MKNAFLTSRSGKLFCASSISVAACLTASSVFSACNYEQPIADCKLSANLTSTGLQVSTDGASCATVDYQVNGAVRRMFIDQQTGVDSSVTSASSGVQIIACKSYSNGLAVNTTTLAAPTAVATLIETAPTVSMQATEQVVSTNLVATGSKMVQVNVPVYEKRIYVERQVPVEKIVYVEKPVYIEKRVPVEQKVYVERPVYIERQVPVEKKVIVRQEVQVDRPVYVPYYIKPEVAVSYNQVVQGLPAGFNGQVPSSIQGQQFGQQFGQYPVQPAGTIVYPTPLPQSGQ